MRAGFVIIGRMKSTRLPKKLTLKINGVEMIAWMIRRLKESKALSEIILATSTNPQDDILCDIAKRESVICFRGSEDDVVERIYKAALDSKLDYVLHVTADCPLVSFDFVDKFIEEYKKTDADLIKAYDMPHGFYMYGMKISALKKVLDIKDEKDTEIWIRYFTETGMFKVADLKISKEFIRRNYRLTLDYPEDYEFFKAVFKGLGKDTYKKSTKEIIEFLDKHPEIVNINEDCEELFNKRIAKQIKPVKLKK